MVAAAAVPKATVSEVTRPAANCSTVTDPAGSVTVVVPVGIPPAVPVVYPQVVTRPIGSRWEPTRPCAS